MNNDKYRVWDKEEKRFWYFTLQEILERKMSYEGSWDLKILKGDKTKYTGLNDNKGKEIYKGDIIKAINRNYDCEENRKDYFQLFEVTYLNGCYMFGNWNAHEFFNSFMFREIVGNKFENPELLEN